MSYCAIIVFQDNKPARYREFHNAWGGHAYIWDRLYNRFLKNPDVEYDSWLGNSSALWDLAKRDDIPLFMRAVHAATFDRAIVDCENLPQFIQHLREFLEFFGSGDKVCHLKAWADFIQEHLDVQAIGFYGTSVSNDLWQKWDEDKEEEIPYDLSSGDKHFEVYEYLESC